MKESKIIIKQFSDKSSNFWVDFAHYSLNENKEIIWCSGESATKEKIEFLEAYIKRNNKVFKEREKVAEIKDYDALFTFGKHSNTKVGDVFLKDATYLKWARDNYIFKSGEEKLKEQIIEILGK